MNRYDVINRRNGKYFQFNGASFPDREEVLWGQRARTKRLSLCDDFEKGRIKNQRPDPENLGDFLVDLPNDFSIFTTNIDAEIAAAEGKRNQAESTLQKLKKLKKADITDPSKLQDAVTDLIKIVYRLIKGDKETNISIKRTAECTNDELLRAVRFFTVDEDGVLVDYCEFAAEVP